MITVKRRKIDRCKQTTMVMRGGKRIAAATESYLNANGMVLELKNFSWEFNLVQDAQVNAFCMPVRKIVVYEGLMKQISSDDEQAVVIGHEVAHAVAKHNTPQRCYPYSRYSERIVWY